MMRDDFIHKVEFDLSIQTGKIWRGRMYGE